MRIDSPLGGEPCAARIPVKCEYESLDLLKREHRGGKPPSSWRSAQVPQLDGCSTGKQSAFLGLTVKLYLMEPAISIRNMIDQGG